MGAGARIRDVCGMLNVHAVEFSLIVVVSWLSAYSELRLRPNGLGLLFEVRTCR